MKKVIIIDVYKRQRLPEEVRFEENRPCIDTRFSEHGEETVVFLLVETDGVPVPVSYTHLDVYKRQQYM